MSKSEDRIKCENKVEEQVRKMIKIGFWNSDWYYIYAMKNCKRKFPLKTD